MRFKTERIAAEWLSPSLHPAVKRIVTQAADRAEQRWDWEFTITCIYRNEDENDALYGSDGRHRVGVHTLWRGVDVRTQDVDPSAVLDITTSTNDAWVYDAARKGMKVALPEGKGYGSSGFHLHFQASAETRQVEELKDG